MDVKDLKVLIKMVTETDITEFEVESADEKIRIKRGNSPEVLHVQSSPQLLPVAPAFAAPPVAASAAASAAPVATPAAASAAEVGTAVPSPIVGTFYRSPAPDAAPYVEVGQVVEKGQILCIVEAMKLMNEIEAEFRCKIVRICKENAQPVEYGDDLFIVEPL